MRLVLLLTDSDRMLPSTASNHSASLRSSFQRGDEHQDRPGRRHEEKDRHGGSRQLGKLLQPIVPSEGKCEAIVCILCLYCFINSDWLPVCVRAAAGRCGC